MFLIEASMCHIQTLTLRFAVSLSPRKERSGRGGRFYASRFPSPLAKSTPGEGAGFMLRGFPLPSQRALRERGQVLCFAVSLSPRKERSGRGGRFYASRF